MPAHDVEVTGSYSVNSYILTYKIDGEVFKAVELSYGESVTPEEAPEKRSHLLRMDWTSRNHACTRCRGDGSYSVNSYTLTYKIDGEVFKAVELSYGESVTPEEAPEKEGHTFSGWTGLPETMPAHDVEVTGSYSVNSYILTYKIDGEVFKAVELSYDSRWASSLSLPAIPPAGLSDTPPPRHGNLKPSRESYHLFLKTSA